MFHNYDSINQSKRIEKKLTDKDFLLMTINATTKYRKKKLLRTEVEGLIKYIREIDTNLIKRYNPSQLSHLIAKNFTQQLIIRNEEVLDTHEILKKQLGNVKISIGDTTNNSVCTPHQIAPKKQETFTVGDEQQQEITKDEYLIQPTIIPASRLRSTYLFLDSMDRNLSTDPSVFKWTVLNSANTSQGTVNTLSDKIHNITVMQFSSFFIPYTPSADNVYRQLSLLIEEFESMSVILRNNRRYHMLFNSEIISNRIRQTPQQEDEARFRFSTPVNFLDTITIKFFSPYTPVTFLKDRYNDVVITFLNPNESLLTFSEDHKVVDGELVHITEFSTLTPSADYVQINEVNKEEGQIVTYLSNTTLTINVDLSAITADPNNFAKVFIASRRISIPIRLIYMI